MGLDLTFDASEAQFILCHEVVLHGENSQLKQLCLARHHHETEHKLE